MNTLRIEATVSDLLTELEITDPTETSVGAWNSPGGEVRVAIIHETGHVYAVPEMDQAEGEAELLFRLPVEKIGVDAAVDAVERYLGSTQPPPTKECEMFGCRNPVPIGQGKSIAPGTYLAVCDDCAPTVSTVR